MAEQLDIRYYVAEKGEVPVRYILIGDSLSFYPNFLESDFEFKRQEVDYDASSGLLYRYWVPAESRFARTEEFRDSRYYVEPRDLSTPGLGIDVETFDDSIGAIRRQSTARVWREEIIYRLGKERVENVGKGLLSLDIPLSLPHSIERIIGKGEETNLTVQGSERIQVSGVSNWCTGCPLSEGRPRQEKFPNLDMKQALNVNLHGNIGEKINVEIQHSSTGEGAASTNRVRLNYKGFEDDVIKLIEMGDTDLSLAGAQLVSYSGTTKGLFGVKAMAQAGPFDVTVIASKEEGETARGTFTGTGGQASSVEIADYDFLNRQFFYFENPGSDFTNPLPRFGTVFPAIGGGDDIDVFVSLTEYERTSPSFTEPKYFIKAVPDSANDGIDAGDLKSKHVWPGTFKRIEREGDNRGYELIQDYDQQGKVVYLGIHLLSPLDENRALAVRYRGVTGEGQEMFVIGGSVPGTDTLLAELICPPDDGEFGKAHPNWHMMMRNVYSLGSAQIDPATLNVRIEDLTNRANRDIHPASRISYLRLFGLDRYDNAGNARKDDRVDDVPWILNAQSGYLQFPWYEPFNPPASLFEPTTPIPPPYIDRSDTLESAFDYSTLDRDVAIYDSVLTDKDKQAYHRYNIVVESASGQRTFQLQAFDIIEGSEVVTLDGTRLARGTDYDIDYLSGTVSLKGDVLRDMTPDSRVSIDYQHKPLIGGGKNSLLGVGANLNLSPNSRISTTFLYSSMGAPKYAPRLGEEPARMMAADVNGNFAFSPGIMTTLANLLPRVDTNAQSSLTLSGEIAMSMPNPNVKGEALVDDMEGIEESNIVNLLRRSWYESSPLTYAGMPFDSAGACEFYWYNPARTTEQQYLISSKRDLNPRLDERENSSITSLFLDPVSPQAGQWCGVMTGFSGGIDLTTAQYLEIWVNDYDPATLPPGAGATVHVDFGWIDENFHNLFQSILDDEAKPPYYTWTSDDDIGFDGDKPCSYPNFDKISDYWNDEKFAYNGINCRKGNGIRDTEDLNGNGRLDRANDYYTFSFNLADSADIDVRRDFPPSDPAYGSYWSEPSNKDKHWRLYRLDLSKAGIEGSRPRLDKIQHMRIWIEDPDRIDNFGRRHVLEIAEVQFVGNRWEKNGLRTLSGALIAEPDSLQELSKLIVGTINNKDDPAHYRSPYAVPQEEGIENREQSLRLRFENFADTTAFSIVKRFFGQGQSYQQYRSIQFFVSPYDSLANVDFYVQIAYDSLNYYEVAVPFTAEDKQRWLWVNITLSDLTNLKFEPTVGAVVTKDIRDEVNGRVYHATLRGNPTLFQVRALFAGLRNRSGRFIEEGEVWFDDVKLGGVRRDIDVAERVSFMADFAGILNVSGSWQRTGPEFRSLRQTSGSGVTNSGLSLSSKTQINYFMPTARFDIPVSARYNSSSALPKYVLQSDVEIADQRIREQNKTLNKDYAFTVSLSRRGSTNFIMKNLFDNLKLGYTFSRRALYSPTARDTSTLQSGNLTYQLNFRRGRQLGLFKGIKWRWWLSNLTVESAITDRVRQYRVLTGTEFVARPTPREGGIDNRLSTLYEPFESVKINFDAREQRVLTLGNYVQSTFGHTVRMNYQPGPNLFIISALNPRLDYSSRYSEDLRPTIRQVGDPWGTRNISNQRDVNVVLDFDLGKYAGQFGQWAHIIEPGEQVKRRGRYEELQSSLPQIKAEWEQRHAEQAQQQAEGAGEVQRDETEAPPTPPPTQPVAPPQPGRGLEGLGIKRTEGEQEKPGAGPTSPDTTRATPTGARTDTTEAKKYNPLTPLKPVIQFLGMLEPLRTNVRMTHGSSYQRIYDRASLLYQLGLSDAAGARGKLGSDERDPERSTDNFIIDTQSGLGLTANIDVNIKASTNIRKDDYSGSTTKSTLTMWPVLDVNWRGLEKYRVLAKYIRTSDLKLHFDRRTSRDQRGTETAYTASPNWNLEWKNSLSSTMSFTYAQKSRKENFQDLWEKNWSVTVGLRYNVSGSKGFGIPLPLLSRKKISFKSTLTTNLDVSYSQSTRYNLRRPASSLSIQPHASYQFSNNVTGAVGISYKRSSGGELGQVNQSIGVDVTAEFRF
jgi:hypothetical protein